MINSMTTCVVYQHYCRAHAQVLVKFGAIKAVTSILERIGIQYSIYDGVEPNPTIEQVPSSTCIYYTILVRVHTQALLHCRTI